MHTDLKKCFVFAIALAIALKFFAFGLAYPLDLRVRGDAYGYLAIADGFTSLWSSVSYIGDRTAGLPFFEYVIKQVLSEFSPTVYLLTWINAIGLAMLIVHITAAWLFSRWTQRVGLVKFENFGYALFVFYATYPALVGHTTSPLTDTLAIDVILLALVSLENALRATAISRRLLFAIVAAILLAFSVLVRPGSLIGVVVALIVCCGASLCGSCKSRTAVGVTLVGWLVLLAPYFADCSQKYGSVCLQSPKTFLAIKSVQDGLRGARVMWSVKNEFPGTVPIVRDESMFKNYYLQCRLTSVIGLQDTSLTGCLLARPLTLPSFVVKKWIGLFDHFRFTPYLENLTPAWLRTVSRAYASLAWLGLALCFVAPLKLRNEFTRQNMKLSLLRNIGIVFLAAYSLIMLAQHTALHTEERYGFPLIPFCAAMAFMFAEHVYTKYRSGAWRELVPVVVFCLLTLVLFFTQISAWDSTAPFANAANLSLAEVAPIV